VGKALDGWAQLPSLRLNRWYTLRGDAYLESVTTRSHWIGDLGHVALADATLGAPLLDMLDILAYAGYPSFAAGWNLGLRSSGLPEISSMWLEEEPELFMTLQIVAIGGHR
jgi:hypothetical protein